MNPTQAFVIALCDRDVADAVESLPSFNRMLKDIDNELDVLRTSLSQSDQIIERMLAIKRSQQGKAGSN